MKVLINKNVLESIVTNTSPYLEKRDLSAITSHIYISAKNGVLNIRATDHEIGLAYKLSNVKITDEGFATANGKKLLDIIKSLRDDEVTLETVNNYLYIKQKNSKYKLPMYKFEDFPEFPSIEGKSKFNIDAVMLGRSLKKILPSIDNNNPKFELNGALLDIKQNYINIVGTDTKRLSVFKFETSTENEFSIIIPKKAINEIQKLFFDKIEIYYDENILIAQSANFEFFTKLINGKYPDYERVIPKEIKKRLKLNRDKMIDGIRTISMLSDQMKMTFSSDNITFESIIEDNSEAKTTIEYQTGLDENFSIGIRNRFFIDFLTNIEDDEFELGFNDSNLAFVVSSNELKTVIMPINL
ncbi:DNA polymerase III subunit beta [Campylobacter sp. RM9344]|uniref:Beta sliding clamp n=1 Tax=Campylobacter californiensis TaxID=1032243 RepID=A0AAW3ZTM4_9BACT|nr:MULTISPECIES: DNA polymerase III subunit beta [unclassified Campylobacter]MBE2984944.1 DNA polymerase III subunit beta [Campylobacter sp. RM6883]MBE2995386.1 DNA polymerase III subunit beta [Campylobacter sp. RM6913]MBE3029957.1 DNA polymerase III subunit beta [Campylobacter sp. RM9344]MBE3608587.1 DNA polymerase III subunit beta [Campylobacter sp. RM9337]QCD49943.1 DNA polymerase III, beta subunit [Campylobacter sp. RM6914]